VSFMETSERRREARAHASPPAQIVRRGGHERVEILNASFRGLFIRLSHEAPPINELFKLRVELPNRTFDVNCVPVRVVMDSHGRPGIGVRFFALNGDDKRIWETYVTSLLSPKRVAA
jgi:hypothetical protein